MKGILWAILVALWVIIIWLGFLAGKVDTIIRLLQ